MNEAGKGDTMRPTDHKKWSNGYDNIKWTKEEDEEFKRIDTIIVMLSMITSLGICQLMGRAP